MREKSVFRFDDSGLRNLLKALQSDHVVRVGVFGGSHKKAGEKKPGGGRKVAKSSSGMTNAEVGFLCEFGRPKIGNRPAVPARSWLRVPLINHIGDIVKDTRIAFERQAQDGDAIRFLKILGITAEKYIQMAFDEGGPGWPTNAPATIARKGSASPNIDTGQLRRAVASQVV